MVVVWLQKSIIRQATEAYYRADLACLRISGGFGLGLYLCQKIVDAHQAEMQVQSQLGGASWFR